MREHQGPKGRREEANNGIWEEEGGGLVIHLPIGKLSELVDRGEWGQYCVTPESLHSVLPTTRESEREERRAREREKERGRRTEVPFSLFC